MSRLSDDLCERVEHGDLAAVSAALREDPSLATATTDDDDTLLHLACWQKHAAIVEALLGCGSDIDARGCYGRTPLHYAVHEGGSESVAIVGMLLARGAVPSLLDNNGFSVEAWARVEMLEGLDDVLALLRGPVVPQGAKRGIEVPLRVKRASLRVVEREAREPVEIDVQLTIGEAPRSLTIYVYVGRSPATGKRGVVVSVLVSAPTRGGGTIGSTFYPAVGAGELDRFRVALTAIRKNRSGVAVLDGLAPARLTLELHGDVAGAHARWSCPPFGPPGEIEGPLAFSTNIDDAQLDALIEGCAAASASIAAWSSASE